MFLMTWLQKEPSSTALPVNGQNKLLLYTSVVVVVVSKCFLKSKFHPSMEHIFKKKSFTLQADHVVFTILFTVLIDRLGPATLRLIVLESLTGREASTAKTPLLPTNQRLLVSCIPRISAHRGNGPSPLSL